MLPPNVHRLSVEPWQDFFGPRPLGHRWRAPELPTKQLGLNVAELDPGGTSCPLHHHLFEEEIFVLLQGELVARELVAGEARGREFPLREGDLVAYPPGTGVAHQFRNRSAQPARFLCLSDRVPGEICVYPDSGKVNLIALGGVGVFGDPPAPPAPATRPVDPVDPPGHVCGPGPEVDLGGAFGRQLSRPVGARSVFVNRDRLPPGASTGPLHAHSADDEIVLVLSGTPTLHQRRGVDWVFPPGPEEQVPLQPGDVVHFAAGDQVAHRFGNASTDDAVLLVVGTDRPHDLCVFPDTGRVHVRALGASGRFERTDYWAGEQPEP